MNIYISIVIGKYKSLDEYLIMSAEAKTLVTIGCSFIYDSIRDWSCAGENISGTIVAWKNYVHVLP